MTHAARFDARSPLHFFPVVTLPFFTTPSGTLYAEPLAAEIATSNNAIESFTLLRRAVKRARLRSFGWHTMRHTFCSHRAMKGVPVRTIQELAGHAGITTTMRYMHLTRSATDEARRVLEHGGTMSGQQVANTIAANDQN